LQNNILLFKQSFELGVNSLVLYSPVLMFMKRVNVQ